MDQLSFDTDGIVGDVHAGSVRPVSMFDIAAARRFYQITGAAKLEHGQFAENILFGSPEKLDIRIFDRFVKDELVLEVCQKGKPFHDAFREPGNYVMPREGIFCRVPEGGTLKAGEEMEYIPKYLKPKLSR